MFPTDNLSSMRADIAGLLPETCVLFSPTFSNDGSGGISSGYTNAGTVACRRDPLPKKGALELMAMAERLMIEYQLTLPYGTTIDAHWRVQFIDGMFELRQLTNQGGYALDIRAYIGRVN